MNRQGQQSRSDDQGQFPEDERSKVLDMLEKSLVFLSAENIENVLRRAGYHSARRTVWTLRCFYEFVDAQLAGAVN